MLCDYCAEREGEDEGGNTQRLICVECRTAALASRYGIRIEPGAANNPGVRCKCFPANTECPSAAVCGDKLVSDLKAEMHDPGSRDVAPEQWERWDDVKNGHAGYMLLLDELRALHKTKSGGYGTSSDPFGNFTAVASLSGQPRYLYPVLLSIEKLTRVLSLHAQGRKGELDEELLDVASLNLCAAAMLREDV